MTHNQNDQKNGQQPLLPISIPSTSITIERCPLTFQLSISPYAETTEDLLLEVSPKSGLGSVFSRRIPMKVAVQYFSIFLIVSLLGVGIFASTVHTGPWAAIEEAQVSESHRKSVQTVPCPCTHPVNSGVPETSTQLPTTTTTTTTKAPKVQKNPKKQKPKVQFHMRMFP